MKKRTRKAPSKRTVEPVWGRRLASEAGQANVAYCAGWDVRERRAVDLELVPYDLWTNRAHCLMLGRAGIIPKSRLRAILRALRKLERLHDAGEFELDPRLEDVHQNVESFVAAEAGEAAAGMMHTARSRNDQVATDMRLFLRDAMMEFADGVLTLVGVLRCLAARHARTLMPGLTHQQPAAWTTLGHWAAAHGWAFTRDVSALLGLFEFVNASPLGAAAAFGTSWPIDRRYAARLLGFDEVQTNTLDCVTNRSECEARVAGALAIWGQHAATLAQDLILFSSPPWSILRIGDAFVTGSSIMPQKRNPDFAEVTKAKAALAGSTAATLIDLTRGDPSGYNREQQWAKYLTIDLFAEIGDAPVILAGALESIETDKGRMRALMAEDYLEAADLADYLAQTRAVPFRTAYRWMGEAVRLSEEANWSLAHAIDQVLDSAKGVEPLGAEELARLSDPAHLVARRASLGGPSPDSVRQQARDLGAEIRALRGGVRKGRARTERGRRDLARAIRAV